MTYVCDGGLAQAPCGKETNGFYIEVCNPTRNPVWFGMPHASLSQQALERGALHQHAAQEARGKHVSADRDTTRHGWTARPRDGHVQPPSIVPHSTRTYIPLVRR